MLICVYLIIGLVITTVMWSTVNLGLSSEKFNINKYDILAIKILVSVGMTWGYPIVILLIIYGFMRNKS